MTGASPSPAGDACPPATDRLWFRPLVDEDLDPIAGMFADRDLMGLPGIGTRTREESRGWLDAMRERYRGTPFGFRALRLQATGEYAGHGGLLRQAVEGREHTEIGYWLCREHRGRGLATEAAVAFRDFAFRELGELRLVSLIHPDNHPSQRVALRNGMRLRGPVMWRGRRALMYSIGRTRWRRMPSGDG